jgi:hypothetical protein
VVGSPLTGLSGLTPTASCTAFSSARRHVPVRPILPPPPPPPQVESHPWFTAATGFVAPVPRSPIPDPVCLLSVPSGTGGGGAQQGSGGSAAGPDHQHHHHHTQPLQHQSHPSGDGAGKAPLSPATANGKGRPAVSH